MIVAGVMSGTSADGINVALVRFSKRGPGRPLQNANHTLLGHADYAYPTPVRRAILGLMNAESARVADLARLNFLLGELYADAIARTARRFRVKSATPMLVNKGPTITASPATVRACCASKHRPGRRRARDGSDAGMP